MLFSRSDLVEPINVIVVDMPRMVREIVTHAVDAEPDMIVVAELETANAVDALPAVDGPSVIIGARELAPEDVHRLLRRVPESAVLMVAAADGGLEAVQLRPVNRLLGEASPARLVEAIRASAAGADVRH